METAFSVGFSASMRRIASSASSLALTSPAFTKAAISSESR